jgi:hypothetical protein
MPSAKTIVSRITRSVGRWFPGAESIAGATAAAGDPSPLLDLRSDGSRRHVIAGRR